MAQVKGQGGDTLLQRARPATLALVMAKHGGLAVLLFAPPMIWAVWDAEHRLALMLGIPVLLGCLSVLAVWRKPLPDDLRGVEAMVSIALLFLTAALLSVPAFMALGLPVAAAFFEGMSAITTTGLSMARDPDSWPFSAHVLRSWMQWIGGLAMATAVLALVLGPGPAARTLGKAGLDQRNRIQSARSQARELLGAYVMITVVFAVAIALTLRRGDEGLVLAMSAVSTGGFAPRSDSLASYDPLVQSLVIAACVAGAVSLLAFAQAVRRGGTPLWRAQSVRRVALMTVVCAVVLAILYPFADPDAGYFATFLNLLSAFSTAGYSTGPMPAVPALLGVFVMVMLIGGDRGSTAGGIKLWRISILMRAAKHALALPRMPERAVSPLRHHGHPVKDTFLVTILGLLLLYAFSVALLWTMFVLLGHPPLPALFDTVSALSTVGLSTGVIGPDLPPAAQIAVSIGMWLGRLEFIAVLVLVLPGTWTRARSRKGK
ncbi:TrkH family potassium uptake protein [Tateyamaria sp. SN6-1]|uniref:TrkH family potassium uptake protein n=1 Tax=Tateyamaria sp. SN6-1 TaxID=3092148 RepID=UPI0039F48479